MDALDAFIAKLTERHAQTNTAWLRFLTHCTGGDLEAGRNALEILRTALKSLRDLLTPDTSPPWLTHMISTSDELSPSQMYSNGTHRLRLLQKLWRFAPDMESHSFSESIRNHSDNHPLLINIDDVIKEHNDQQSLNILYMKAIKAIEEAIADGLIDSKQISNDLERILSTIESATNSSFLNQALQIPKLVIYLKAFAKVSAKRVPVLNFVLDVLEEAETQIKLTHTNIEKDLSDSLHSEALKLKPIIENQLLIMDRQLLIETVTEVVHDSLPEFQEDKDR